MFEFWNTLEFLLRRRLIIRSYVTNWVIKVEKIRVRVISNKITGLERRPEAMQRRLVSKWVCNNCRGMCELRDQIGVRVGVGVRDLWRSYVSERGLRERAKYPKSGSLQATRLRHSRKTIDATSQANEYMRLWLAWGRRCDNYALIYC